MLALGVKRQLLNGHLRALSCTNVKQRTFEALLPIMVASRCTMKKMLLTLTAILSLATTQTLVATGSTSNQIFTNADGTIAITNPRFSIAGKELPVSIESDLDGVCRLLGFSTAIENGFLPSEWVGPTVSLHRNAAFKGFVVGKKIEMLLCNFWPNVECEGTTSSHHNTKHRGQKGLVFLSTTVTCSKPWTGSALLGYPIAYSTDINAICPLLRYHSAPSSLRAATLSKTAVQLDIKGNFAAFMSGGTRYESVTCHYEERVL